MILHYGLLFWFNFKYGSITGSFFLMITTGQAALWFFLKIGPLYFLDVGRANSCLFDNILKENTIIGPTITHLLELTYCMSTGLPGWAIKGWRITGSFDVQNVIDLFQLSLFLVGWAFRSLSGHFRLLFKDIHDLFELKIILYFALVVSMVEFGLLGLLGVRRKGVNTVVVWGFIGLFQAL